MISNKCWTRDQPRRFPRKPSPAEFVSNIRWTYPPALSSIHALRRGFDATTFGTPTERVWSRGDLDARHQLPLQGGYARRGFTLSMFGRVQSGLPFTPIVGGDVNGDGRANDRAFIFDPARAPSATVASDLRALLASSSSHVRQCLTWQLDRPRSSPISQTNTTRGTRIAPLKVRSTAHGN